MVRTPVGQESPEAAPGPVLRLCWLVVLVVPPLVLLLLLLELLAAVDVCGAAIEAEGGADFFGLGMNSCWPIFSWLMSGSLSLLASAMSYVVAMSLSVCELTTVCTRPVLDAEELEAVVAVVGCAAVAAVALLVVGAV